MVITADERVAEPAEERAALGARHLVAAPCGGEGLGLGSEVQGLGSVGYRV